MFLPVRFENPPSYLTEVGLWSYINFYFCRCNRCMFVHSYISGDARGISNMTGQSQQFIMITGTSSESTEKCAIHNTL